MSLSLAIDAAVPLTSTTLPLRTRSSGLHQRRNPRQQSAHYACVPSLFVTDFWNAQDPGIFVQFELDLACFVAIGFLASQSFTLFDSFRWSQLQISSLLSSLWRDLPRPFHQGESSHRVAELVALSAMSRACRRVESFDQCKIPLAASHVAFATPRPTFYKHP